ncbi:MAG: hypothetical protein EBV03_10195 [Proteobacteria bacterium]|nr:hypothetical protein [Pseudomonadota bacterium]
MSAMKTSNHTFQLLVLHGQEAPIEVQATCLEEACAIVKDGFSAPHYGMLEFDAGRDMRDAWLVMRTTPYEYCDSLQIFAWDGACYKSFAKAEIGSDILSALHKYAPGFSTELSAITGLRAA